MAVACLNGFQAAKFKEKPMQQTPTPQQAYPDDEISLIELWQILARRKALILACFIVSLAAGAAVTLLQAPVFEANVILRIGQVKSGPEGESSVPLEYSPELTARLLARGGISKATVQKDSKTIVQLAAIGGNPEDAKRKLEDAVQEVLKTHEATLAESTRPVAERIKALDLQHEAHSKQYAEISALINQLRQRDPVQAALLLLERRSISSVFNQLEAERHLLAQLLTPPQTQATELLGSITAPAAPVKPKTALVLALAAVLGVMGGVMLAFFAEFMAKAKQAIAAARS